MPLRAEPLLDLPAGVARGRVADARPRSLPTGSGALDDLLGGGLPRGRLTEIHGPPSSGRTSLLISLLAAATRAGEVVALVDPGDGFEPRRAEQAGVRLERVLWVRAERPEAALRAAELLLGTRGFGLVALDLSGGLPPALRARAASVWARLARRAASSTAALLVLAGERESGGAAALALELRRERVRWRRGEGATLLDGIDSRLEIVRSRDGRTGRRILLRAAADAAVR